MQALCGRFRWISPSYWTRRRLLCFSSTPTQLTEGYFGSVLKLERENFKCLLTSGTWCKWILYQWWCKNMFSMVFVILKIGSVKVNFGFDEKLLGQRVWSCMVLSIKNYGSLRIIHVILNGQNWSLIVELHLDGITGR